MSDIPDAALDTVAAFLKALSDHALEEDPERQKQLSGTAMAWMRHLTIGGPHSRDPKTSVRDFGGAKRFASQTLTRNHAAQIVTANQLRDTTWAFVSNLHRSLDEDQQSDGQLRSRLGELKSALASDSLETLRRATQDVCRDLFRTLEQQKQRRESQGQMLTERLPGLVGMIENDEAMTLDRVTGLFDRSSMHKAAEKLAPLSALTGNPVAVILISLKGARDASPEACDDLMKESAPLISRAFFRRDEIVGREGDSQFAVLAPGCDLDTARKMAAKAIVSDHMSLGVAPLCAPVDEAFSAAEREAA